MARLNIQTGERYGKLTVINDAPSQRLPSGQINRFILCKCDCGNTTEVRLVHLVRLKITSCGCLIPRHGDSKRSKVYDCWRAMINRITETYIDAHRYFHRGITVCDQWRKYTTFRKWALSNGFKEGLQIDRRDNDKGYYPENCRFVPNIINVNNREVTMMVEYEGVKQSLQLILHSKSLDPHYGAIYRRIQRGWKATKAIDTPIRKGNYGNRWKVVESV